MSANSSPSNSGASSLALSLDLLLPEKMSEERAEEQESSISEHISTLNSFENDRSILEIEITNVVVGESSSHSATKNAQSVLNEILRNEQFCKDYSDRNDYMVESNDEISVNIFDGVTLLKHVDDDRDETKVRSLEDALSVKDSIIHALNVEIESLKDTASHPSTLSTLTEYKQLQDECATKFVQFETAIAHRDCLIGRLTDALSVAEQQCEQYTKDIQCLQKELAEAGEYLRIQANHTRKHDLDAFFAQHGDIVADEHKNVLRKVKQDVHDELVDQTSILNAELRTLKEKHAKEMEEARKYYEKKCADMYGS